MRGMKESRNDFVGKIPCKWEEKPVRVLFDEIVKKNSNGAVTKALKFTYGQIIPKTDFDADTDDYVANTILTYKVVEPNTIMINCLNLNFDFVSQRVGLVKDFGVITSAYLAIKAKNENVVYPQFASYQLKAYDNLKAFHNMGTGVRKTLDFSELGKKYFVLPPLDEQRAIAAYLDEQCEKIDSVIADIQAQIDTLEDYKKAIITEAVTKGLTPDVEMKETDAKWLPNVPAQWGVNKAKYLFATRRTKGNDICLELLSPTQKYGVIPQSKYEELSTQVTVKVGNGTNLMAFRTIHKGDYCISLRSFEGGFEYSEYEGVVSPAYTVFFPTVAIDRDYYRYLFKIEPFIFEMNSYSLSLRDGKPISFENFGNTLIPIPPIGEQRKIADYLKKKTAETDSVIADKQAQIETLEAYKKSLIYEYVTGKKEVPAV